MLAIGEAMRLERPAGWQQLISVGAGLAAVGLALGLVCAVVILSGSRPRVQARVQPQPQPRVQARAGSRRPSADPPGGAAPDSAEGWLDPLRDAAVRPVSAAVRETAAARAEPPGAAGHERAGQERAGQERAAVPESAGTSEGGHVGPHYSDEGWRLDGTGPIPMAQHRLADPPQEIHHPVRPMSAPRAPGQRLGGDTGQMPAYNTGQMPAYNTGQMPAYNTGQMPAYNTGQMPAYETGRMPAYDSGQRPAHESGQLAAYDPEV